MRRHLSLLGFITIAILTISPMAGSSPVWIHSIDRKQAPPLRQSMVPL
jgi:hypothetical protein